jgi:hypothetical protein
MQVRRIEKLEEFWHARTMSGEEALRLINGLLASCAKHCDAATTAVIAEAFSALLSRCQRGEKLEPVTVITYVNDWRSQQE